MENQTYPNQICQDEMLTRKFIDLHTQIVDKIIKFCKDNDINIDEFHLSADGVMNSIKEGKWMPYTDSSFTLETDLNKHKPFLLSI